MTRRTSIRRSFALALACTLALTLLSPASAALAEEPMRFDAAGIPTFTLNGGGWGHGIGMSQYGAEGYSSVAGWNHSQILSHYFQGTSLRTLGSLGHAANPTVKVNIDDSKAYRSSWTFRGYHAPLQGVGSSTGTWQMNGDVNQTFTASGGQVYYGGVARGNTVMLSSPTGSPALVLAISSSGPFDHGWILYRGSIRLTASGSTLKAVNHLPLESYLSGVVPREMPASWSLQALKSQAVAARSYAWASGLSGELYCTAASQVYGGYGQVQSGDVVEHYETANAAVSATAGEVVYYAPTSKVVQTFFSSSTGGHTANIEDVWTGATPQPYFRGVPDSYDYVKSNPKATWDYTFSGLSMASKLAASSYTWAPPGAGSSVWVSSVSVQQGPSGYPKWSTFTFSNGQTTKESSWDVRQALSLPSPNFRFGAVPVTRVYGEDRYETAVAIAAAAFPETATAVVVARGDDFSDALVGSAVAGAANGPLLLARRDSVGGSTLSALGRLKPRVVYIMGGHAALGPQVDAAIAQGLPDVKIVRIAGADRFETAAKAAQVVVERGGGDKVFVANGYAWPDAAAASALAWARKFPILLVRESSIPAPTRAQLESMPGADVIVVGGDAVISRPAREACYSYTGGPQWHLAGSDRYATAAAVAHHEMAHGFTASTVYLATGEVYADALTGGTLAGVEEHPLGLTPRSYVAGGTASLLNTYQTKIEELSIFGGPNAVTYGCVDDMQDVLSD